MIVPAASKVYVRCPISAVDGAGKPVDLSAFPVSLAFTLAYADPAATDWQPAAWDTGQARILIGPGAFTLSPGAFTVWVQVVAGLETPVLQAGRLTIV